MQAEGEGEGGEQGLIPDNAPTRTSGNTPTRTSGNAPARTSGNAPAGEGTEGEAIYEAPEVEDNEIPPKD